MRVAASLARFTLIYYRRAGEREREREGGLADVRVRALIHLRVRSRLIAARGSPRTEKDSAARPSVTESRDRPRPSLTEKGNGKQKWIRAQQGSPTYTCAVWYGFMIRDFMHNKWGGINFNS